MLGIIEASFSWTCRGDFTAQRIDHKQTLTTKSIVRNPIMILWARSGIQTLMVADSRNLDQTSWHRMTRKLPKQ
jgi:hypothetical protein